MVLQPFLIMFGLLVPPVVDANTALNDSGRSFAHIVIDSNEVQLGEPFEVVLLAEATAGAVKADFSGLADFSTRFVSRRQGVCARGARYELHYAFVARRSGKCELPAIEVSVGNELLKTQALDLHVLAPEPSAALELDISLSKERCYVGEAIELSIAWRMSVNLSRVKAVDLHIPILTDKRFDVLDRAPAPDASSQEAVGIPVGNRRVIARGSSHKIGETEVSTLTFTKLLVPRQTGLIEIEQGSVYCALEAGEGQRTQKWNQYPSYFNNDFFKRDVEGKYKRYYARSAALRLEVMKLPQTDRPAGFYGLVSAGLELSVKARPVQVDLGTPMTIELRMRARQYIENLELRPLYEQARLALDFSIPRQRPPFAYDRGTKVFTQTLRPLRADIERIGAIEVPYFDTDAAEYGVARSRPLAIEVLGAPAETETAAAGQEEPGDKQGLLVIHVLGIALVFALGVGIGLGLFVAVVRKRQSAQRRSSDTNALAEFERMMADIPNVEGWEGNVHEAVYSALRAYLGTKLGVAPQTLVCKDALKQLGSRGVDVPMLERLEQVFYECDVCRFGGCYTHDNALDAPVLKELALSCTRDVDRYLDTNHAYC